MAYRLVSIILPVHNQADHIGPIIDEYITALSDLQCGLEYLLIVNGCQDNTADICRQLGERHPSVRVIETQAKGWGLAVKLGLREAKGDVICYTNAARTSPKDLANVLGFALAHPHVVIKAVRGPREDLKRRLGSFLYNVECQALFGLSWGDINGTPKVFPAQFAPLLNLRREDDLIDLEFSIVCRRQNYPLLQLPISSTRRHGGKSTTNYGSAIRMVAGAYHMWRKGRKGLP